MYQSGLNYCIFIEEILLFPPRKEVSSLSIPLQKTKPKSHPGSGGGRDELQVLPDLQASGWKDGGVPGGHLRCLLGQDKDSSMGQN